MSFFRDKDGELSWDVIAWLLGGIFLLVDGFRHSHLLGVFGGGAAIAAGVGKGLRQRWAGWLLLILLLGGVALQVTLLTTKGITLWRLLVLAATCYAVRHVWVNEIRTFGNQSPEAGDEDKPLISLVLLLSKPRYLEEKVLTQIVESAWGGDYSNDDEEKRDGFVVGGDALYIIRSPMGMFIVHNHPVQYWDEIDEMVEGLPDLRLRKLIQDHQAWLSVDFLGADKAAPDDLAAAYAVIIRLLHELADETVLGMVRPETGRISEWTDDVVDALLRPQGEDKFHRAANVPIVQVAPNDSEMAAAVAEARRRWPEFTDAFARRQPEDFFSIKAPVTVDDVTEFIWIRVHGLEPEYIHGDLANDPLNLGDLKLGSRVEVPVKDLNDWAYGLGDNDPVGLFTVKIIMNKQKAAQ